MQAQPVLEMQGISKSFPGVKALEDVNLSVRAGEVHALMGENGAGKSTLMNILCGKLKMDSGQIRVNGEPVEIRDVKQALSLGISMIHQELNFVPMLTVAQNIYMGKEIMSGVFMNGGKMRRAASLLLSEMNVRISPDAKMGDLSVSQQQMVEIAKAVSNRSKIIVMDEPTSAITQAEVRVLFRLIADLKSKGIAIIYISHKMDEIFEIADTITVLRDGKYIGTRSARELDEPELISMMVGREIGDLFPKEEAAMGEEILRVEGLCGDRFHDVSFSLKRGEILGFAGLMGAGRTEIMRALYGLDKLHSGKISVRQKPVRIRSTADAIRHGIGFVSEDRKEWGLVLGMSIRENVTLTNLTNYCKHQFVLKKLERRVAGEQIRRFSIKTPSQEQQAVNLSGGNQQKVVLAKTLLSEPDILILDEPTRGIDVGAKAEIHRMISNLAAQGKGILMISSEMPEVLAMSDRIVVMHEGEMKGELSRDEATQESIMEKILSFNKKGGTENA